MKESVRHKTLWARRGLTSIFQHCLCLVLHARTCVWGPFKNQAWFSEDIPHQQDQLSQGCLHSGGWASCWNQSTPPVEWQWGAPVSRRSSQAHLPPSLCHAEPQKTRSRRGLSAQPWRGSGRGFISVHCQQFLGWCCSQDRSLELGGFGWLIEKTEWGKERKTETEYLILLF